MLFPTIPHSHIYRLRGAKTRIQNRRSEWRFFNRLLQTLPGVAAGCGADPDYYGDEGYHVAAWAARIRAVKRLLTLLLTVFGIDASAVSTSVYRLNISSTLSSCASTATFTTLELMLEKNIFYIITPVFQYILAILISESWQYFGHRWMHSTKSTLFVNLLRRPAHRFLSLILSTEQSKPVFHQDEHDTAFMSTLSPSDLGSNYRSARLAFFVQQIS